MAGRRGEVDTDTDVHTGVHIDGGTVVDTRAVVDTWTAVDIRAVVDILDVTGERDRCCSVERSGALSGRLDDAVTSWQPGPAGEPTVSISGTLNATPWVLPVSSYERERSV